MAQPLPDACDSVAPGSGAAVCAWQVDSEPFACGNRLGRKPSISATHVQSVELITLHLENDAVVTMPSEPYAHGTI